MTECGLSGSYIEAQDICLFAMRYNIRYKCALWDFPGEKYRLRRVMTKGKTGEVAAKIQHPSVYLDTKNRRARRLSTEILGKGPTHIENRAT